MKSIQKLSLVLLTAAAFAAFPVHAQSDSTTTATNKPAGPRRGPPGFTGTVMSIDATAMTLKLKGRGGAGLDVNVKVTSDTKITKSRQPAVFADITEGVRVTGRGKKEDDGSWTASAITIIVRPPRPAAPPDSNPATPPAAPPAGTEQK